MFLLIFKGVEEGKCWAEGWGVGVGTVWWLWRRERKLVLSPKFAPGSFSAAVLVKRKPLFFFSLWVHMFIFKRYGRIPVLLSHCSSDRGLRSLPGDTFPPDFFHFA